MGYINVSKTVGLRFEECYGMPASIRPIISFMSLVGGSHGRPSGWILSGIDIDKQSLFGGECLCA